MNLSDLLGEQALLDGGYGWLLPDYGLEAGECAELWNIERPEPLQQIFRDYADAGSRLLTTNTFGGSRVRLEASGLGDRTAEINRAGAAIARSVADAVGEVAVGGCVGPLGELLEPYGLVSPDEATQAFAEQVAALIDGGADVILIETMSDLAEAEAAIAGARSVSTEVPIMATMSFDTNLHTMMGVSPAAAVAGLSAAGAEAVGANCGRGPEEMAQIAAALVAARPEGLRLVVQSNAGLPQVEGDGFIYTVDPAGMAEHAAAMRLLGIDYLGACCGSSPAHLAAMGRALKS